MNPEIHNPLEIIGNDFSAALKTNDNRLVLVGNVDLTIIESDGQHWTTERISWDGIKNVRIEGNIIYGLAYDIYCSSISINNTQEWFEFHYDLEKKELVGGTYHEYAKKKKSWWTFWK